MHAGRVVFCRMEECPGAAKRQARILRNQQRLAALGCGSKLARDEGAGSRLQSLRGDLRGLQAHQNTRLSLRKARNLHDLSAAVANQLSIGELRHFFESMGHGIVIAKQWPVASY